MPFKYSVAFQTVMRELSWRLIKQPGMLVGSCYPQESGVWKELGWTFQHLFGIRCKILCLQIYYPEMF